MSRKYHLFLLLVVSMLLVSTVLPTSATPAQAASFVPAAMKFGGYSGRMTVSGASTADGARIEWTHTPASDTGIHKQWRLYSVGSNRFQIKNINSGKCLDVDNSSTISTTSRVQQWACLGSGQTNQLWKILGSGDMARLQLVANTNYCIDGPPDDEATIPVKLASCSSTSGVWVDLVPNTLLRIKSVYSGKCLDLDMGNWTQNGARIQQWDCLGTSQLNQLWSFPHYGSSFRSHISGKCLEIQNSSNGQGFYQWTCGSFNVRQFDYHLGSWGDDRFELFFGSTHNFCIDLDTFGSESGYQNGARIQKWECNGQTNQQWQLSQLIN